MAMPPVYMIKDVARLSGQSIHTVKFYLKLGLLREVGRSPENRYRYFDDSTIQRLQQIRQWRKQCKSLQEIQRLLV
jgi:DNA-binding transcriptional MerR regulator